MDSKSTRNTALLAIIATLIAVTVLSAATFAWFTFTNDTSVSPLSGTISRGDGSLLISASPNGPFDVTCDLPFESTGNVLYPISTADLVTFYTAAAQNEEIVTAYRDATGDVNSMTLHGRVYLKAEITGCNVYFWPASLTFGDDVQALASMRLGLRFTTAQGTKSYIFRLDEFGNTAAAETQQTTAQANAVVSGVGADGAPVWSADPSQTTAAYRAAVTANDVAPGASLLCSLAAEEIGSVEYWLYLEGCDENCIRTVQGRDVALQLGFAGVEN